jgi:hypothetical protein
VTGNDDARRGEQGELPHQEEPSSRTPTGPSPEGPAPGDAAPGLAAEASREGTAPEEAGQDGTAGTVCALPGCDNPLPPPPAAQDGRRRGGRPPAYCCKAHADAASRQRRAQEVATVSDPLLQVRSLAQVLVPGARELVATVQGLLEHLDQAQSGALARVRAAEEDAERARKDVGRAERKVEAAERRRTQALEQAREEARARSLADERAAAQAEDTERVRRAAWEQVAEHERARGRAEAARAATEEDRDRTTGRLRQAEEQVRAASEEQRALAARLTQAEQSLTRSVTDADNLRYRCAELRTELDRERTRAQQVDEQLVRATQELFEQRETTHRTRDDLERTRHERDETAARLTALDHRLHQLLAAGLQEVADADTAGRASTPCATCPVCGHRARGPQERRRLRRELDAIWLEPACCEPAVPVAGSTGESPPRGRAAGPRVVRYCAACAPRKAVVTVGCLSCGGFVRAVRVSAEALREHLDAVGWRTGEGPDLSGSLCPDCCSPQD